MKATPEKNLWERHMTDVRPPQHVLEEARKGGTRGGLIGGIIGGIIGGLIGALICCYCLHR
jgi:predicted lipid-binding transport protein (Tim44 family)